MRERLQKVLSAAGVASRRQAEALIAAGQVTVNGQVAEIGQQVDPETDLIEVRGEALVPRTSSLYLAYHKPVGLVTSRRSTHGEPTIFDQLQLPGAVFPVGRLDRDTSGLLFLTNDGAWANVVTHPRYGVEKEYEVVVRGRPGQVPLRVLREGVSLPDGSTTAPAQVRTMAAESGRTRLAVTVTQGKKRQIRLMFQAVGFPEVALRRVRIDGVVLDGIEPGEWRHLEEEEIAAIRSHLAR